MFKNEFCKISISLFVLMFTFIATGIHPTPVHAAGIIYVNTNASGANNGSSWGDAYLTLQDALAAAASGDQIWVAAGVYYPDAGLGQTNNSRSSTFTLINGVQIYGGFAGTEALLSERNISANVTILSGDLEQNDTNADADFTAETTADIIGDNAYHVVRGGDATATTILDGFTITAGNADGPTFDTQNGGGLFNWGTNPTVQNVIFSGNNAEETNFGYGGGVYNYIITTPAQFTNVTFTGNNAYAGGGMAGDSDVVITGATFINNTALNTGGGLEVSFGSGRTLTDVTFTNNTAVGGGAMSIQFTSPTLTNVTFSNNTADSAGAVLVSQGNPEFINVTFDNNTATDFYGGAVQLTQSAPTFRNVTFSNNSATISGGGIFSSTSSDPTLANVTFTNNSAVNQGGGMYTGGGGDATLTNVTFSNNSANLNGGGLYALNGLITLQNTIIANSTNGGDCYAETATLDGTGHNLIESTGTGACGLTDGVNGNIIGSDPNLGSLTGSPAYFPLNTGSPAIDAGDDATCAAAPVNNTSQNGVTRPQGSHCDIGAYEVLPPGVPISIGGVSQGTYTLAPDTSQVLKYAVDGGPVVIGSGGGPDIIASLNQWRRRPSTTVGWTGVSQSMGLPVSLITDTYYFPRYDDSAPSSLYNAMLLANVDTVSRDITVTIGGVVRGTYTLAPSASQFVSYPGVVGGPVVVSSDPGARIVASLYELIRDPSAAGWNGQSEMMGLPASQLSDEYLIPIYFGAANPNTLNASLHIANVSGGDTTVEIWIAGVLRGSYPLAANTGQVVKYALDGGPVVISSNNGANIVASLNQWRRRPSTTVGWTGVSQSMALPVALITNEYVIPRYDDSAPSSLYNALLLANVDTVSRDITVTIGGVVRGTYSLAPSASQFVSYPGVVGGPVVVSSDPGAQIVASLYELIRDPSAAGWNGQSEMMGLPLSQLSDQYLIPLYFGAANPNTLNASLYIAVP